MFISYRWHVDI